MIDTHCHLTFPDFEGRVAEVLAEAAEAGITGAITISTTSTGAADCLAIAREHADVWCTSGIHPLHTAEDARDLAALAAVAAQPECVAWGELGMDKHYDEPPLEIQRAVLLEQLELIRRCDAIDGGSELAGAANLPIVVHSRRAAPELLPILKESGIAGERFVFHCFTEAPEDARAVLDFGAMISFTGVVTYKNAPDVRASAGLVPLDRMMVETDAPFLSPVPVRGERPCRPAFTAHTARFLAELKDTPWDEFEAAIDANTGRFFGITVPPVEGRAV